MTLNPLNHKRLSSTSRIQSCPRLRNLPIRKYRPIPTRTSPPRPHDLFPRSHRQPPQIRRLPERRPPKDRGLPSPHPGWVIAQGLHRMTAPKPASRFFGSCLRTVRPAMAPSEHVIAIAVRNTLPEFLTTAAETSLRVKLIADRLDLSGPGGWGSPRAGGALWASPALPSVRFPLRLHIFIADRLDLSGTEARSLTG